MTTFGRPRGAKDKEPRNAVQPERNTNPDAKYLSAKEVAYRYKILDQRVRIWAREGKLPAPYPLGENTIRWRRSELDRWDENRKPVKYARR